MKLHLGSGKRFLPDYIHVDLSDYEHIDHRQSIDNLDNFKNESINEIYASHVFEYFDLDEARNVLKEWNRVLEKNGILRLAVPNFEALIKVYEITGDLNKILGPLYGKWEVNDNLYFYHKIVYDQELLTSLLKESGFENIKLWDWREIFKENKNYDDHSQAYFPHMDKENGIHVSLNIQGQKIDLLYFPF